MPLPSEFDNHHIPISRKFIDDIRELFIDQYVKPGDLLLMIGNQGKYKRKNINLTLLTLQIQHLQIF